MARRGTHLIVSAAAGGTWAAITAPELPGPEWAVVFAGDWLAAPLAGSPPTGSSPPRHRITGASHTVGSPLQPYLQ